MPPPEKIYAYVPGLSGTEKTWRPLVDKLRADLGGEWIALEHRCGPFSRRSPEQVARSLSARLEALHEKHEGKPEIILIGHSIGGLLLRTAYLMASGQFGREAPCNWPLRVTRFVLMASMDRGVNPEGSLRARIGTPIARFLRPTGIRLIYELLKGSNFITNLRISWIRYYRNLPDPPQVVQVLGTNDDEVARDDCLDPELFPHAKAINVPEADHVRLHDLTSTPHPDVHYQLLRKAIAEPFPRHAVSDEVKERPRVIILLHGIRASRYGWPESLRREIHSRDPNAIIRVPDYGYFSARRFAIPYLHRKPLRWFQDQYSQALAQHPNAEFYFVGHSNGTYLMAKSLRDIGGMYFRRVFLGGCVLSPSYAWPQREKTYEVHNAVSYTDMVVGVLCSALAGLGRQDVGTAGFESFRQLPGEQNLVGSGHSAAFDTDEDLKTVANFILDGTPPPGALNELPSGRRRLSRLSGTLGYLLIALLIAILVYTGSHGQLLLGIAIVFALIFILLVFLEIL
jgi:pimeloyl-ACP methyl ester carboxylesterase